MIDFLLESAVKELLFSKEFLNSIKTLELSKKTNLAMLISFYTPDSSVNVLY